MFFTEETMTLVNSLACKGCCLWIIYIFLFKIAKFRSLLSSIDTKINDITKYIDTIDKVTAHVKFNDINMKMKSQDSIIRSEWIEFEKSLIKTQDEYGNDIIFRTMDASIYFNNDIINNKVNIESYSAIPGILTGIGLFGTFLGLTIGLNGINLTQNSSQSLSKDITKLLGGVHTAFVTSLLGIFFALAYQFAYKDKLNEVKKQIENLQSALNDMFDLKTPEFYLSQVPTAMAQQLEQLKKFNSEIAMSIATNIDQKVAESIQPSLQGLLEAMQSFNQTGVERIGKIVLDGMRPTNEKLAEALNELNNTGARSVADAVSGQVGTQLDSFAKDISSAADTLKANTDRTSDIVDKMNNGFEASTKNVTQMLDNASQKLNDTTNRMIEAIEEAGRSREKQVKDMNDAVSQSMTDTFARIASELSVMTEKIKAQNSSHVESLGKTVADLTSNMQNISSNISHTFDEVSQKLSDATEKMITTVDGMAKGNEAQVASLNEAMLNNLSGTFGQITSDLSGLTGEIRGQNSLHEASLEKLLTDAVTNISGMSEHIQGIQNNSAEGLNKTLNKVKDLTESMEIVIDEAKNAAAKFSNAAQPIQNCTLALDNSINNLKNIQNELIEENRNIISQMHENSRTSHESIKTLNTLFEQVKSTVDYYNKNLKGTSEELDSVFNSLTNRIKDYKNTVEDNLKNILNGFDNSISSAFHLLETSVSEMQESVDNLELTVSRLEDNKR